MITKEIIAVCGSIALGLFAGWLAVSIYNAQEKAIKRLEKEWEEWKKGFNK